MIHLCPVIPVIKATFIVFVFNLFFHEMLAKFFFPYLMFLSLLRRKTYEIFSNLQNSPLSDAVHALVYYVAIIGGLLLVILSRQCLPHCRRQWA